MRDERDDAPKIVEQLEMGRRETFKVSKTLKVLRQQTYCFTKRVLPTTRA